LQAHYINGESDHGETIEKRRIYRAALVNLERYIEPPRNLAILDQKSEGACTGFGLAAVINYLNQLRGNNEMRVSARMLYEMAKRYDEWEGENYSGSSLRGAIKGWYNMGAADDGLWKYTPGKPGHLTVEAAKNARKCTIGAYYRLKHRVSDFHAALNEARVIYCSARVHTGWRAAKGKAGVIPFEEETTGLAIWTYEDWQENIMDAWVLRLALPTPQIWHLPNSMSQSLSAQAEARRAPNRSEIAGHFIHIDDGRFHETGKYWSTLVDVKQTADLLQTSVKYDHVILYAHGGLNSPTASARRIRAMKEVYKENRIYAYHFMYDTGVLEELKDVIFRKRESAVERARGITEASDWLIEKLTRIPGRALWREMKRGARLPFYKNGAGTKTLEVFLTALKANNAARASGTLGDGNLPPVKIHLVGHSTGAILLGWLLKRLTQLKPGAEGRLESVSLMAPAASIDFFEDRYVDLIKAPANRFGINRTTVFNLNRKLEKDDTVGPYRKSLLYLVSRAFEEKKKASILGMEKYAGSLPELDRLKTIYSQGRISANDSSRSESHGGFDNDVYTLNSILDLVLPSGVTRPFKPEDLGY
jgi:hypothetical protein